MTDQDLHQHDPDPRRTESVLSDFAPIASRVPERIGRYHIKRVIASGGMGTVYEATQDNPRRVVAVKVMKQGIASKSALRRFEYEGQILGRLRHPGIAQIYEAGTHDDPGAPGAAVPYFAMEYISNAKTITKFADEKKLGTRQRMELFAKVCDAIHHGHQKGIIHRDLKPGNILVDSHGEVKVIDFGVARGTDSDLAVTMQQTDIGQLVGTLQYMSPEQCEGDPHDIDTRSDVYALGVVLYELLSGKLPYDVSSSKIFDGTRMIREQHPTKLSTLDRTLRGDVETITLKALEKERERRYQSASELAQDIRRYLSGEAVIARRASIVYQLRVFARKNKAVFASLAAVFAVLVAGIIVSTSLYVMADRARAEQSRERRRAEALNDFLVNDMLASADPEIAQGRELRVAEVLDQAAIAIRSAFVNEPELEASIRTTLGATYSHLGLFDEADTQLQAAIDLNAAATGSSDKEALKAAYYRAEALKFRGGRSAEAESLLRQTLDKQRLLLGSEHPDVIATMNMLGNILNRTGTQQEAASMYAQALELSKRVLGPNHLQTLKLMNNSALMLYHQGKLDDARGMLEATQSTTLQVHGKRHPFRATPMKILASIAQDQGRLSQAERLYREIYDLEQIVKGQTHPDTLQSMITLAGFLMDNHEFNEGLALVEQAHSLCFSRLGVDDQRTLDAMSTLAIARLRQGYFHDAVTFLSPALERSERIRRSNHPKTISIRQKLMTAYMWQGSLEPIPKLAQEIIDALPPEDAWWSNWRVGDDEIFRAGSLALYLQHRDEEAIKLTGHHLAWLRGFAEAPEPAQMSANNYAWALCTCDPPSARDGAEAVRMAQRAVEATNARDATVLDSLAAAYALDGDLPKAVETQRTAVSMLPRRGRPANLHAHIHLGLVSFLRRSGQPAEANASKSELLARVCEGHAESKCRVMERLGELIVRLFENGQVYIGESLAGVVTDMSSGVFENDKADLVRLPILYALRLQYDKKHEATETILRECQAIRQLMLGESDWRTAQSRSLLGGVQVHLERFDEAGPMLKESLAQLQSVVDTPPEELANARTRLAEYESALAAQLSAAPSSP